jgi:hypothetical protein
LGFRDISSQVQLILSILDPLAKPADDISQSLTQLEKAAIATAGNRTQLGLASSDGSTQDEINAIALEIKFMEDTFAGSLNVRFDTTMPISKRLKALSSCVQDSKGIKDIIALSPSITSASAPKRDDESNVSHILRSTADIVTRFNDARTGFDQLVAKFRLDPSLSLNHNPKAGFRALSEHVDDLNQAVSAIEQDSVKISLTLKNDNSGPSAPAASRSLFASLQRAIEKLAIANATAEEVNTQAVNCIQVLKKLPPSLVVLSDVIPEEPQLSTQTLLTGLNELGVQLKTIDTKIDQAIQRLDKKAHSKVSRMEALDAAVEAQSATNNAMGTRRSSQPKSTPAPTNIPKTSGRSSNTRVSSSIRSSRAQDSVAAEAELVSELSTLLNQMLPEEVAQATESVKNPSPLESLAMTLPELVQKFLTMKKDATEAVNNLEDITRLLDNVETENKVQEERINKITSIASNLLQQLRAWKYNKIKEDANSDVFLALEAHVKSLLSFADTISMSLETSDNQQAESRNQLIDLLKSMGSGADKESLSDKELIEMLEFHINELSVAASTEITNGSTSAASTKASEKSAATTKATEKPATTTAVGSSRSTRPATNLKTPATRRTRP